jgi:hypothetical protein
MMSCPAVLTPPPPSGYVLIEAPGCDARLIRTQRNATGPAITGDEVLMLAMHAEMAALKLEAERLAPVIAAAQEWSSERMPSDHAEGELMKAIATMEGDWPGCEDCDHECDEPCMPATVVQMHGSIDACLAKLDAKKAADARKHWGALAQAVQP